MKLAAQMPAEGASSPVPGASLVARADWNRRYKRMRADTAQHLLSAALPYRRRE